jgi:hypothetical protein
MLKAFWSLLKEYIKEQQGYKLEVDLHPCIVVSTLRGRCMVPLRESLFLILLECLSLRETTILKNGLLFGELSSIAVTPEPCPEASLSGSPA